METLPSPCHKKQSRARPCRLVARKARKREERVLFTFFGHRHTATKFKLFKRMLIYGSTIGQGYFFPAHSANDQVTASR